MAQRPPRMPRRPTGQRPATSPGQSEDSTSKAKESTARATSSKVVRLPTPEQNSAVTELPTDAIKVLPTKPKTARRARQTDPDAASETKSSQKPRPARLERAKQKQSQRRRVDRVKFSAAVRRNPGEPGESGEPAVPKDAEPQQPVAAHRFSGRIAALLVVLAFFAVMLVPTINHYRNQMHDINELRAAIAELETQQRDLKEEIARWDDPLYIKQQARDRINLVMPGERVYMVVGEQPAEDQDIPPNASTYEVRQELPWVDALLDSMRRSGTD